MAKVRSEQFWDLGYQQNVLIPGLLAGNTDLLEVVIDNEIEFNDFQILELITFSDKAKDLLVYLHDKHRDIFDWIQSILLDPNEGEYGQELERRNPEALKYLQEN